MNPTIELIGNFESMANEASFGPLSLPKDKSLSLYRLNEFINQLTTIQNSSKQAQLIGGNLICATCERVLPKSKRIKKLFSSKSTESSDCNIRGIFFKEETHTKHAFIYFLTPETLDKSIQRLVKIKSFLSSLPDCRITSEQFNSLTKSKKSEDTQHLSTINLSRYNIGKTELCQLIYDLIYIEKFEEYKGEKFSPFPNEPMLIQLIETIKPYKDILDEIGITTTSLPNDHRTFLMNPDQISTLLKEAPYLISMSVGDHFNFKFNNISGNPLQKNIPDIPTPTTEAVIGVIDTAFDKNAYFSDWVTYIDKLDIPIDNSPSRRKIAQDHGTKVSSIIVDGPTLNPYLDDGCGRFRVRHFRLMNGPDETSSTATIIRKLHNIIQDNRDIRVWNFSLGEINEIDKNYISIIGSELDRLQYLYDVLFIVSGSNSSSERLKKLGAPADSLNSLVVNSVRFNGTPASYSRSGPVLSFFTKPDICYFGGDIDKKMIVWGAYGATEDYGTSFAAAWISRKAAFLIYYMNLSREVTKALLIDSAADWSHSFSNKNLKGFGIVPVRIENILKCNDDEIRFVMHGTCNAYDTYTFRLPVPIEDSKYPFYARATLCYFPEGERWQGVDYTQTELDLHFGRLIKKSKINKKNNTLYYCNGIKTINNNSQGENDTDYHQELDARNLYRKWDNVKRVSEPIKIRRRPRNILNFDNPQWGLSIRTKERLSTTRKHNLQFGVVITLKDMFSKNRLSAFIKNCQVSGWIVNPINIESRLNLHVESELEIKWDNIDSI